MSLKNSKINVFLTLPLSRVILKQKLLLNTKIRLPYNGNYENDTLHFDIIVEDETNCFIQLSFNFIMYMKLCLLKSNQDFVDTLWKYMDTYVCIEDLYIHICTHVDTPIIHSFFSRYSSKSIIYYAKIQQIKNDDVKFKNLIKRIQTRDDFEKYIYVFNEFKKYYPLLNIPILKQLLFQKSICCQ